MSITDAEVNKGNRTLAARFAAHLGNVTNPSDVAHLVRSFELSLRAANKAPKTIKSYTNTVRGFCMFLVEHGMPNGRPQSDEGARRDVHRRAGRAFSTKDSLDPVRGSPTVL